MSVPISVVGWFRETPIPSCTPTPAVVIGGTRLLSEFLATVAEEREGGQLAIASPYIGRSVRSDLPAWDAMPHRSVDLLLVTNSRSDARTAIDSLGRLGWRSLLIQARPRLHAKIYSFVGTSGGACLVGSHNLSFGGASANLEAGVLFVPRNHPELRSVPGICRDRVVDLGRTGRTCFDSLRWPEEPAA